MIRVFDEVGNVIETHKHAGGPKECSRRDTVSGDSVTADFTGPFSTV
jgi:hypothetical protein